MNKFRNMKMINPEHLKMHDFNNLDFQYLKICKVWFDSSTVTMVISHPSFEEWRKSPEELSGDFRIWCIRQGIESGDELQIDFLNYLEEQAKRLLGK